MEILIAAGANVNLANVVCQSTPLMHAADSGSFKCVEKLLSANADSNRRNMVIEKAVSVVFIFSCLFFLQETLFIQKPYFT